MPRIRVYYNEAHTDNNPLDFCRDCWDEACATYEDNPLAEITVDDHPPYDDTDYKCELCRKPLTEKDD